MVTVTETLARWASNLTFEQISHEAVDAAKLFLYDSVGCALGGYQTADATIFIEHARAMVPTGSPLKWMIDSSSRR